MRYFRYEEHLCLSINVSLIKCIQIYYTRKIDILTELLMSENLMFDIAILIYYFIS